MQTTDPSNTERLTGVAGSWKTQELSFEVAGRVQYVAEPETDIEGRIFASAPASADESNAAATSDKKPLSEGTELARIDPTRYQLKVASAEAQIDTIAQQRAAVQVEIDKVIPAERSSAEAELKFQVEELKRIGPLVASRAVTQSDLDRVQANHDKALASLAQIDASKTAKQAEIKSLDAQILEANQSLSDAKRNVEECIVFSPFRGQIATVDVIPGAYVTAGQAVLNVQMMDPIKIELEVSAGQSRRLTYKDSVDVVVSTVGEDAHFNAIVYMIDPAADPNTRTFTVTLLMENDKVRTPVPPQLAGQPLARTRDTWRFFTDKFAGQDVLITEMNSIHEDDDGAYVWKITNGQQTGGIDDRLLDVKKIRVLAGELHIPFLDIWTFRELQVAAGEDLDPQTDLIAGKLELPAEMSSGFDGGQVLFDRPQWLVRPGDLVAVNLSGDRLTPGFYVPISVISEESDKFYVHSVDSGVVRRVEVNVFETVNTSHRIEAVEPGTLVDGVELVAKGTHFLVDGEPVLVTGEAR
ncbi:MAG: HlyD family efflux transporter periplasmic adaptor subunit [Planctomycetota bacterium]|nr:HlyD family efflux transporter periplasmic adaptor subunit [Planctomycetota bacterium]